MPPDSRAACRTCHHFRGDPAALEAALPGLDALSSAYASVRAGDGLCSFHDRYVASTSVCRRHACTPVRGPRARNARASAI